MLISNDLNLQKVLVKEMRQSYGKQKFPLDFEHNLLQVVFMKETSTMKKLNLSLAILALAAMSVNAQTSVNSEIVGYQTISVPVGLSTAGFPLLNPDVLKVATTTLTGVDLALAGQTNVGALLSSVEPYYIEVYSGTLKGDRFDVDVAATIAAANGNVVLNSASLNNTLLFSSVGTNLNGATVALRKHVTIEQVQGMASAALVGNNSASSADQIQFYDNATAGYAAYYLRLDGVTWRKVGTTTAANKTPIPSGVGIFILKKTGVATLTAVGNVRLNDFSVPYQVGLQLVAPGVPIDVTPASQGGTVANGWTGNNSASLADQIQVYNPDTSGYDAYFLRADGTTWRKVGTTTAVTTAVATSAQAFFVSRKTADSSNILLNPVTN
jgi:hypothetical protein